MANEFQHKDPGSELTQAEYITTDGTGHIFDGQAAGDILYASSTTVLKNLAKATDGNVLELASGLPAWTASPTIGSTNWGNANHAHAASNSGGTLTTLGTVTTGVWQGTAIASGYIAADAITGAKIADDAIDSEHYTDGSIDNAHLADDAVDSDEIAAGAIDTAHIADNQVTVAKIEDIARGSIIYGNASAASAELTKGSANYVLTSDGTDIAWAAAAGGPDQANQTAIEGETNQDTYVPPDLIKHSPGVAKAWICWHHATTINASYNITSITNDATGFYTITIATDFSGASYARALGNAESNVAMYIDNATAPTAGATKVNLTNNSGSNANVGGNAGLAASITFFGDQ